MVPTPTQTQWKYLRRKPGSRYRQLFVGRIAARTLYGCHVRAEDPQTIEEIALDWNLPIEAVKEAVDYCVSSPPELELDYLIDQALMDANGMNDPRYKLDPKGTYRILAPEERARIENEVVKRFNQAHGK